MTLTKLMTTAAASAIIATSAFAAGETLDRQNPQPTDEAVSGATEFNGEEIDTEAQLQTPENKDLQNPQAIDPIFDREGVSAETAAKFTAVKGAQGSDVLLNDGMKIGTLLEIGIDNAGKGEITIDVSEFSKVAGDELVVTTGPENVDIDNGKIVLATDAQTLSTLTGGNRGADDTRERVYLN